MVALCGLKAKKWWIREGKTIEEVGDAMVVGLKDIRSRFDDQFKACISC